MRVELSSLANLLHLLTDEEREVVRRKFWGKESISSQANGDPVKRHQITTAYRSALRKLKELLT